MGLPPTRRALSAGGQRAATVAAATAAATASRPTCSPPQRAASRPYGGTRGPGWPRSRRCSRGAQSRSRGDRWVRAHDGDEDPTSRSGALGARRAQGWAEAAAFAPPTTKIVVAASIREWVQVLTTFIQ
eukprot:1844839-Prymnesium_polylepis.1